MPVVLRPFLRNLTLVFLCMLAHRASAQQETDFFESKIRPVLVEHCYDCHSADAAKAGKLKAGLLLDSRDGILLGGDSGTALVAGQPKQSLLIRSIMHGDGAPEMPPKGKLPQAVIDNFVTWVERGATDPRAGTPTKPKTGMSLEDGRKFWSLLPPQPNEPPSVNDSPWNRSAIDRYVRAGLESSSLQPAAAADSATWLRRVFFDSIGLPPTIEQVAAFEADPSDEARAKIVESLLTSQHFGERWGRHWLDSVRYADSNGRDRNVFWYYAWRYRDYVIAAFNQDKPFDQFIREQIAGDLLLYESSQQRDQLRIATGFLALGSKAFEEQKSEVFRMDVIDEQIEVIGRSILGLSIGCARCHDHKFDPIPTRDYYAIAGILRSTQPLYGYGPKGIKATNHHHSELYAIGPLADSRSDEGLRYIERLNELTLVQNTARSDRYRVVRRVADAKLQLAKPDADKSKLLADIAKMEAEIKEWDLVVRAAEDDLQCAMDSPPSMPDWAMGARERGTVEDCRVHIRGDTLNLGEFVRRGTLQVLPNSLEPMPELHSGRLELANWLVDRTNPLTARVYVNRVWQHLFGRGLVATPDDFGVNGSTPSHPGLLDYLAVRFMDQGWSTKRLLMEILLSRTYAASSQAHEANQLRDPDNVYLWRMPPRRLEAEVLHDSILVAAGQLDFSVPDRPTSVFAKLYPWRDVEYRNFSPEFAPEKIEHAYRGVYLPVVRGVLPPIFQLFDFAAPDRPIAMRDQSTVPAQSLFLMNNEWIIQQSRLLATAILQKDFTDDSTRVQYLFRLVFARQPRHTEVAEALEYLQADDGPPGTGQSHSPTQAQFERWTSLCQAIFASAEFRYLQ